MNISVLPSDTKNTTVLGLSMFDAALWFFVPLAAVLYISNRTQKRRRK